MFDPVSASQVIQQTFYVWTVTTASITRGRRSYDTRDLSTWYWIPGKYILHIRMCFGLDQHSVGSGSTRNLVTLLSSMWVGGKSHCFWDFRCFFYWSQFIFSHILNNHFDFMIFLLGPIIYFWKQFSCFRTSLYNNNIISSLCWLIRAG